MHSLLGAERAAEPMLTNDDDFVRTLESHKKILFKIARLYARQTADRNDLIQEMTIALWQSYPRFDARSKWSTWMYRVCLNVAISAQREQRRQKRHAPMADPILLETLTAPDDERHAHLEIIQQLIRHLPQLDRALILLHLEGQEHEEIAQILSLSVSNVATRLGRIKQKLQADMAVL